MLCFDDIRSRRAREAFHLNHRLRRNCVAYTLEVQMRSCATERTALHSRAPRILSRSCIVLRGAEERCRKELGRKNVVVEISVVSFFPELFRWYEAQGYRKKRLIPFPVPELIRDGCGFELQLMTKTIP